MGYTHCFTQLREPRQKQWERIRNGFQNVAWHPSCPKIWGAGINDTSTMPTIRDEIIFNGGHETMYVSRFFKPRKNCAEVARYCKTACKPYDVAVVALLILMYAHAPEVWKIASSGLRVDWMEGLALAQKANESDWLQIPASIW